jgi:hypothetical protein
MNESMILEIIPITPNTGGVVSPTETVGRADEIAHYWSTLHQQGIALFAERRFGKSSILRKMEAECPPNFIAIYKPIEGLRSKLDFYRSIFERIKERQLVRKKLIERIETVYDELAKRLGENPVMTLKILEKEWETEFSNLLSDLQKENKDKKIVIILDEFSIFLSKIDPEEAVSVIGFLRDISNEPNCKIRFIYCGSIGIDLVLDKIKSQGYYIGDPLNHLKKIDLEPFTDKNAFYFGQCLELGCELKISEKNIKYLCKRADNIPYFIDFTFDQLRKVNKKTLTKSDIDKSFNEIIEDGSSKISLKHFFDRIDKFYPNSKLSIFIMNTISKSESYISESEISNLVFSQFMEFDRQEVNNEIDRLRNDNYLNRKIIDNERTYTIKYNLLKLWWARNKAY